MKKYKKAALNIAILTMILSSGLTSRTISLARADLDLDTEIIQTESSNEQKEKIIIAFENNDFETWQKLIGSRNQLGKIIDENGFNKFIEARNAARDGNYEEAISITESLKNRIKIGLV